MIRIAAAAAALVAVLTAPATAWAQFSGLGDAPFEITADTIDYERGRDVYVARGHVVIIQEQKNLSADWVSFSPVGGRGVASGNVVFSDGKEKIFASFAEFGVTTLQGVLFLGRFEAANDQFRLEGDEILKTGDDTYAFENGTFTTCRCPDDGPEPWKLNADSADLTVGGYAFVRNTTINILGVPVLWFPWMALPLKNDRETGFLFPEFQTTSRNGATIGLPFFWAPLDSVNVIVTPRWLQKRGFKVDGQMEYVIGEKSFGSLFGAFIHDNDVDSFTAKDPYDDDRWAGGGKQDMHLPFEWRFKADAVAVSDNSYPFDFEQLDIYRRNRFLISDASLTKHLGDEGRFGVVAKTVIGDDLQSPDDQDRDNWMLQRLPTVELWSLPQRMPWVDAVVTSLWSEYTYFGQWQNPSGFFTGPTVGDDQFYDTGIDALFDVDERRFTGLNIPDPHRDDFITELDGKYEDGEVLADRGSRLLLHPRISIPHRFGKYVEIDPQVGVRQSFYDSRAQGLQHWMGITARADARVRLQRSFGNGVTHILEPRLGYALMEVGNIDDDPFFVPNTILPQRRIRETDLDNVTRNFADDLDDFNGMTWGVGNRFYRRASGSEPTHLIADVNITMQYDFANGGDLGLLVIESNANPLPGLRTRFVNGFDLEKARPDEMWAEILYEAERIAVGFRYRFLRHPPEFFEDYTVADDRFNDFKSEYDRVNQVTFSLGYRLTERWSARWQIDYSFETSILLGNRIGVEYLSKCDCWAAGIQLSQNRQFGFNFGVLYRIVGLGNDTGGLHTNLLDGF